MFYKGRLRVAGDEGDGIPVDLSLDDVYVDLRAAGGEELGRWRMDVVEVARLEGSDFQLVLDGEEMVFRASDPLGFAYNAVTTIEDISSRLRRRRRGLFRRKGDTPKIMRGAEPDRVDENEPRPMTEVSAERLADLTSLLPPEEPVELPPAGDELFAEFTVEVEEDVAAVSYSAEDTQIDAAAPAAESVDGRPTPPPEPQVEEPVPFEPVGFEIDESSDGAEPADDEGASVEAVGGDDVVEMDLETDLGYEDTAPEAGLPDATEATEQAADFGGPAGEAPQPDSEHEEAPADSTGDVHEQASAVAGPEAEEPAAEEPEIEESAPQDVGEPVVEHVEESPVEVVSDETDGVHESGLQDVDAMSPAEHLDAESVVGGDASDEGEIVTDTSEGAGDAAADASETDTSETDTSEPAIGDAEQLEEPVDAVHEEAAAAGGETAEGVEAVPLEQASAAPDVVVESEVDAVPLEESVSVPDSEGDVDVESEPEPETPEPETPEPASAPSGPIAPGASTRAEASRKRRFFGRNRVDPEHEHQYDESRTVGGITRRVCSVCGHVSFAGEDLYEGWQ